MELPAHPVWTLWRFLRWFSARMVPLPNRLLWAADRLGLLAQAALYPEFRRQLEMASRTAKLVQFGMDWLCGQLGIPDTADTPEAQEEARARLKAWAAAQGGRG